MWWHFKTVKKDGWERMDSCREPFTSRGSFLHFHFSKGKNGALDAPCGALVGTWRPAVVPVPGQRPPCPLPTSLIILPPHPPTISPRHPLLTSPSHTPPPCPHPLSQPSPVHLHSRFPVTSLLRPQAWLSVPACPYRPFGPAEDFS